MSDAKTNSVPPLRLHAKTIQLRLLRAQLRPGRRWTWWGQRGWWLHCSLLHEQDGTWHKRRFVATVAEACTLLEVQPEDWTWQPVERKAAPDTPSGQQGYVPLPLF